MFLKINTNTRRFQHVQPTDICGGANDCVVFHFTKTNTSFSPLSIIAFYFFCSFCFQIYHRHTRVVPTKTNNVLSYVCFVCTESVLRVTLKNRAHTHTHTHTCIHTSTIIYVYTNLYGDAVEPVAVDTQIKRVDADEPIRRRDHTRHQRHLNK